MNSIIRGGIGSQIMCMASDVAEHGAVGQFAYSLTGYTRLHKKELKLEDLGKTYLQDTMNFEWEPSFIYDGTGKGNTGISALKHMIAQRDKVVSMVSPKEREGTESNIVHVRKYDADQLDEEEYWMLIEDHDCTRLITDDPAWCERFELETSETSNPAEDWLMLANSKATCVGGFSTFTLMAAYFNPDLEVKLTFGEGNRVNRLWGGERKTELNKRILDIFTRLPNVTRLPDMPRVKE